MIKQIYFDFGGVLVNYHKAFTKVCSDFNLDFSDFWNHYHQYDPILASGELSTVDFWDKCIQKYNLQNAQDYDLAQNWVSDYEIIQPIYDLIYSLENKLDVGIISNICQGPWEAAFKYQKVPNINYHKVYLSYQEKLSKPEAKIYQKVQLESKVNPPEILFVDDKQENLIVPQKLGWKTVLFDQENSQNGLLQITKIINSP